MLGALLLAGGLGPEERAAVLDRVCETGLTAVHFYWVERHGFAFEAIEAVVERGDPRDALLAVEELQRQGRLEAVVARRTSACCWGSLPRLKTPLITPGSFSTPPQGVSSSMPGSRSRRLRATAASRRTRTCATWSSSSCERGPVAASQGCRTPRPRVRDPAYVVHRRAAGPAGNPRTSRAAAHVQELPRLELVHKLATGGSVLGRCDVLSTGPTAYYWRTKENELRRLQGYAQRRGYNR